MAGKFSISDDVDWKKLASDAVADEDVERAFYEQALMTVANRCGDLMRDGRHIGFEIVDKNDDDTRMVGIFVFRTSDDIFYVPVFFINGIVKGGNSIYSKKTGEFMPLNKRIAGRILKKHSDAAIQGQLVNKNYLKTYGPGLALENLALPKGLEGSKYAACADAGLEELLAENPVAMLKFAEALERDYNFANLVYQFHGDIASRVEQKIKKKAAAVKQAKSPRKKAVFTIHLDPWDEKARKAGAEISDVEKGFYIEGPDKDLFEKPLRFVGAKAGENNALIFRDGSIKNCDVFIESYDWHNNSACENEAIFSRAQNAKFVIFDGKKVMCAPGLDNLACAESELKSVDKFFENLRGKFDTKPGIYVFFKNTGIASPKIKIVKIFKENGVITYCGGYGDKFRFNTTASKDVPEYKTFAAKNWAAVKIADDWPDQSEDFENDNPLYFCEVLNHLARATNLPVKMASVAKKDLTYTVRLDGSVIADNLSRLELEAGLCACGFGTKTASDIASRDFCRFEWPVKAAAAWPDLGPASQSSQFAVMLDEPQYRVVPASEETRFAENTPWTPGQNTVNPVVLENVPDEILMTKSPVEIGQIAQQLKLPQVFDHAVVGELSKLSGLTVMLDKHLPRLKSAVDSLGRLLFVLYWRPAEFEQAFGVDDMRGMENNFMHLFESLGDLLLDLEARSDVLFSR